MGYPMLLLLRLLFWGFFPFHFRSFFLFFDVIRESTNCSLNGAADLLPERVMTHLKLRI